MPICTLSSITYAITKRYNIGLQQFVLSRSLLDHERGETENKTLDFPTSGNFCCHRNLSLPGSFHRLEYRNNA